MAKKQFKADKAGCVLGPGRFKIDADHPILAQAIAAMLNDDWAEARRLTKKIGLFDGEIIEMIGSKDPRHFSQRLRRAL